MKRRRVARSTGMRDLCPGLFGRQPTCCDIISVVESHPSDERDFRNRSLRGQDLSRRVFEFCDFVGADLSGCWLANAEFNRCNLSQANLSRAWGARVRFVSCSFDAALLPGLSLVGSVVLDSTFSGALLTDASFLKCDIERCSFQDTHLDHSAFREVKFIGCSFEQAQIAGVAFLGTDLSNLLSSTSLAAGGGFTVDWLTICLSLRSPALNRFLVASRMPDAFVVYSLECARAQDPDVRELGIVFHERQRPQRGTPCLIFKRTTHGDKPTQRIFVEHAAPTEPSVNALIDLEAGVGRRAVGSPQTVNRRDRRRNEVDGRSNNKVLVVTQDARPGEAEHAHRRADRWREEPPAEIAGRFVCGLLASGHLNESDIR